MSEDFIAWLHELFADFGPIRTRAMFGGHGVYSVADDIIIGVVIDDALYLKVDADNQSHFQDAGCAPFLYRIKGKDLPMSYWSVPADAMDSAQAMLPWARSAREAALRKPVRKAGKKRKAGADKSG